jgi:hypothetical protein
MKSASSPSSLWLRLPGPTGWEWWSRGGGSGEAKLSPEPPKMGERVVYGFDSGSCDSVPTWVSSADPEIIGPVLQMELERLGVRPSSGPGRHMGWRSAGSDGPRRLIQTITAPGNLEPGSQGRAADWTGFHPSPLFFRPPARSIVLWRELDRWIVGFENHEAWIHFQSLGPGELDANLLREIQCLQLELEGRRMVGTIDSLIIWSDGGPVAAAFRDEAQQILGVPVRVSPKPSPTLGLTEGWTYEPAEIATERERQANARRWMQLALVAALVYVLLIGAGVADLMLARRTNAELRAEVDRQEPAAAVVREAKERWEGVELALDVDRYPVELFFQVAKLFPEKGLRMTHFEVREDGQIVVRGEASSVPVAIGFKADLEGAEGLKDYEWNIPAPEIQGDTATFVAFGTYRFAPANEI